MFKSVILALSLLAFSTSAGIAEDQTHWPVKPSEAAIIAQRSMPGAVVLNVRPLPGGEYVVTLRAGNKVLRVTVNGRTGAVN